jgi:hypothetical protein
MKTTATATGVHRADFIRKVVDEYLTKRERTDEETRQREILKRIRRALQAETAGLVKELPKA